MLKGREAVVDDRFLRSELGRINHIQTTVALEAIQQAVMVERVANLKVRYAVDARVLWERGAVTSGQRDAVVCLLNQGIDGNFIRPFWCPLDVGHMATQPVNH